jgi:hypothetical protein
MWGSGWLNSPTINAGSVGRPTIDSGSLGRPLIDFGSTTNRPIPFGTFRRMTPGVRGAPFSGRAGGGAAAPARMTPAK